jgi:hypothetical protein
VQVRGPSAPDLHPPSGGGIVALVVTALAVAAAVAVGAVLALPYYKIREWRRNRRIH